MSWSSVGRFFLSSTSCVDVLRGLNVTLGVFKQRQWRWFAGGQKQPQIAADCTGLQPPTKDVSPPPSPSPCFIFLSSFIFSHDAESQCRETLNMILMSANRCFISVCCRDFVKGEKKIKYYNHLLLPPASSVSACFEWKNDFCYCVMSKQGPSLSGL